MAIYQAFATGYNIGQQRQNQENPLLKRNIGAEALAAMPSRAVIQRGREHKYERARELARLEKEQEFRHQQEKRQAEIAERDRRWQRIREQEERQHQRYLEQERRAERARKRAKEAEREWEEERDEKRMEMQRNQWNMALAGTKSGFYQPFKDYMNRYGSDKYNVESVRDVAVGNIKDPETRERFMEMGPEIEATEVIFDTDQGPQYMYIPKSRGEVGNSNLYGFARTLDPTPELGTAQTEEDVAEAEAEAARGAAAAKQVEANLKVLEAKDKAEFKRRWGGFSEDTVQEVISSIINEHDPLSDKSIKDKINEAFGAMGASGSPIRGWRLSGNTLEFQDPDGEWQKYATVSGSIQEKLEESTGERAEPGKTKEKPKEKPRLKKRDVKGEATKRQAMETGGAFSQLYPGQAPAAPQQTPGYYGGPQVQPPAVGGDYVPPSGVPQATGAMEAIAPEEIEPGMAASFDVPGTAMERPEKVQKPKSVVVDPKNNQVVVTEDDGRSYILRMTESGIVKLPTKGK